MNGELAFSWVPYDAANKDDWMAIGMKQYFGQFLVAFKAHAY